jgi:hypothetical protein
MISKLKKLAKEFDLNFNKKWFKHIWISKKENIMLEFMWMCPDPIYKKYGATPLERAKQIENFLTSTDFEQELLHRFGGQVINKKTFTKYFSKWISEIENLEIKKDYQSLYKKIFSALGNSSRIAILTKSKKENEIKKLKSFVLFHEWIHVLVNENNLKPKNWKYNEGLVTYFQEFTEGNLDDLEKGIEKWKHYNFQKQYFIYAIKFRELLKEMIIPSERKTKLKKYLKRK